jgi:hypothetical protein
MLAVKVPAMVVPDHFAVIIGVASLGMHHSLMKVWLLPELINTHRSLVECWH